MTDAFVGRQAIYDRSLKVHGYELLYRGSRDAQAATHICGDQATARVIWDAFLAIGAERVAGDVPCFLNLTKAYITGELPMPLPANRVIIEVLEDVLPTEEVVAGLQRLKQQGVKIALDDYIHRDGNEAMLEMADYVKVDLRAQGREKTRELYEYLSGWGVKLLAEKVETMEELRFCMDLGFDYFQGFFLTRPETIEGRRLAPSRLGLMRTLSRLHDPEADLSELEDLIGQDVSLVYKLLLYANSSMYAPAEPIEDIQHALVTLGLDTVRKIVSLIILMDLGEGKGDLIEQSLVRARMCQSIAEFEGHSEHHGYFTAGLLSTLDALTGVSMEQVLEDLSLSESLVAALVNMSGPMGSALRSVRAYEVGDWANVVVGGATVDQLRSAYVDAVVYSRSVGQSMTLRRAA